MPEPAEDLTELGDVLPAGLDGHQDVIDVDEVQAMKDLVHEPLEGHPCILQTKRHVKELKEAEGCDDSSLGDH